MIEDLEVLTFSKDKIQVVYTGAWDSIQVVLLLPMRTLGHLLYLAVHYPGLLRGLNILQIIDISSLTIIDFQEITGILLLCVVCFSVSEVVCVCVCVCMYVCAHVHARVGACLCVCACMHACVYVCVSIRVSVCVCACVLACLPLRTCLCECVS